VIERLRPIIVELERTQSDLLVVTHNVVMRTLLAYFIGIPLNDVPKIQVPLHTLYCLRPTPYGADLQRFAFDGTSIKYVGDGLDGIEIE
jgi:6-phosphofructo-2-kinase